MVDRSITKSVVPIYGILSLVWISTCIKFERGGTASYEFLMVSCVKLLLICRDRQNETENGTWKHTRQTLTTDQAVVSRALSHSCFKKLRSAVPDAALRRGLHFATTVDC
jgi:hypothetical protein